MMVGWALANDSVRENQNKRHKYKTAIIYMRSFATLEIIWRK